MRASRPSPRLFLAAAVTPRHRGSRGIIRPGRWVSGRESRHLPPVEAGAETPVVVQDAKVLVAGCKGARSPPARWVQGEPKSPCVAMQRRSRCVGRDGLDARQRQRPAEQSLGETLLKSGRALGIAWGVRGGWEIPPQGGRGSTAHTLYVFEWRRPAILYYGERTLNCGEHYSAAIRQSRNVRYSDQWIARYSRTAQGNSVRLAIEPLP